MDKNSIVILSPMDCECDLLVSKLENTKIQKIAGYIFYEGNMFGLPVTVCRCLMGNTNAAVCTLLAIQKYSPRCVILQGTAGAHTVSLEQGDIVIAEKIVPISNYVSKNSGAGCGIDPLSWEDFGIETFSAITKETRCLTELLCDKQLTALAKKVPFTSGKVVCGTVGCGDVWNKEVDMINHLHSAKGTLCEAMEGIGAAQACTTFGVPMLEIRVISNNELVENKQFAENTAQNCQNFVCGLLKLMADNLQSL